MSETFNEYYARVSSKARRKALEEELGIVRCKDCKYWYNEEYQDGYCCESDSLHWDADDFCSRGKRRGEEDD